MGHRSIPKSSLTSRVEYPGRNDFTGREFSTRASISQLPVGMITHLSGTLQRYDWGGADKIAGLLGLPSQTLAEWWIGAHPKAPATLPDSQSLDQWIADDPPRALGRLVAEKYGELPYLLKILDIRRPLSIQIHPTARQAREGFAREESSGIALNDPDRNFRDPNHKPELAVALEPTWMLFGFRTFEQSCQHMHRLGLGELLVQATSSAEILERWLRLPVDIQRRHIDVLGDHLDAARLRNASEPDFWIADWNEHHPTGARRYDPGVLGFLLFNIVELQKHAGIFLAATVPHAYLRGSLVEVMANSDNVLRCGLTTKNVDVDRVMETVERHPQQPAIMAGDGPRVIYQPPVDEFGLERLTGEQMVQLRSSSAELWMCLAGSIHLESADSTCALSAGQCALVSAQTSYAAALRKESECYRTFVPDADNRADR